MNPDRLRVADGRRVETEETEWLRRLLDAEILPRLERPGRYVGVHARLECDPLPAPAPMLLRPSPSERPRLPVAFAALRRAFLARGRHPSFSCTPTPELMAELSRHQLPTFTLDRWEPTDGESVWLVWMEEPAQILGLLSALRGAGLPLRAAQREPGMPHILVTGPGCATAYPLLDICAERVLRVTTCDEIVAATAPWCEGLERIAPETRGLAASELDVPTGGVRCLRSSEFVGTWRIVSLNADALPHTRLMLGAASSRLRAQLGLPSDENFSAQIDAALRAGQVDIVLALGHADERAADRAAIGVLASELAQRAGERRRRIQFELTLLREAVAPLPQLQQWLDAAAATVRQSGFAYRAVSAVSLLRERRLLGAMAEEFDWLEGLVVGGCYAAESELAQDPKAWDNCDQTREETPLRPESTPHDDHAPTGLRQMAPSAASMERRQNSSAAAVPWRAWQALVPQQFDYRLEFAKRGRLRHLSCKELGELLLHACQQAGLSVATAGVAQPKPKISFGPPLAAGVEGLQEFVDLSLTRKHPDPVPALSDRLPEGFTLRQMRFVPGGIGRNGLDRMIRADYSVHLPAPLLARAGVPELLRDRIAALREDIASPRPAGSDLIQQVQELELVVGQPDGEASLRFALDLSGDGKRLRPRELIGRLLADIEVDLDLLRLRRTRLWARAMATGELLTPMQLIDRHVSHLRATEKLCA